MINRKTFISAFLLGSSTVFAGTMGEVVSPYQLYVGVEGGASISNEAHFQPKINFPRRTEFFFLTPVNTDWSRDIGSTGLGGAFIGYQWNSNVAVQFSYAYRNGYDWNLLTTGADSTTAPGIYDRYNAGNITIQTYLMDLKFMPSVNWGGFVPYVKGGVGVAVNKIKGLQNIDIPFGERALGFNTLVRGKSSTNFAWDAGTGINYNYNENLDIGLGYRFVDSRKLRTSKKFIDTVSGQASTISPFEARHIYLNEVVASVAYHFNFS